MESDPPPDPGLPFPLIDDRVLLERARMMADQVAGTLHLAVALAETGRRIDLTGLERVVGQLCARVVDLDPTQGRDFLPRLEAMVGQLDALQSRLTRDP